MGSIVAPHPNVCFGAPWYIDKNWYIDKSSFIRPETNRSILEQVCKNMTEPVSVAKDLEDFKIAVKCQSRLVIAGFLRIYNSIAEYLYVFKYMITIKFISLED